VVTLTPPPGASFFALPASVSETAENRHGVKINQRSSVHLVKRKCSVDEQTQTLALCCFVQDMRTISSLIKYAAIANTLFWSQPQINKTFGKIS